MLYYYSYSAKFKGAIFSARDCKTSLLPHFIASLSIYPFILLLLSYCFITLLYYTTLLYYFITIDLDYL